MKNNKICFNKKTGVIALVGIVIVGAIFAMNFMTSKTQSTSTRAYLNCPGNSVPDYGENCPDYLTAAETDGMPVKVYSITKRKEIKCCYPSSHFSIPCPPGSHVYPSWVAYTPAWCNEKNILKDAATYAKTGKTVDCCNYIGSVGKAVNSIDVVKQGSNKAQGSADGLVTGKLKDNGETATSATANDSTSVKDMSRNNGSGSSSTSLEKTQEYFKTKYPFMTQNKTYCAALGLSQVPTEELTIGVAGKLTVPQAFVQTYYEKYCKANENKFKWNGGYGLGKWGAKAECYSTIGVCASSAACDKENCLRGLTASEKCLNIQVDFSKCVSSGVAPIEAAPSTLDAKRCKGTCEGGTIIGNCPTGYKRRCMCTYEKTGSLVPRFVDDTSCPAPLPEHLKY